MELPITVDDLLKRFDVVDTAPVGPTWDFMWTGVVEEDREKRLSSLPFTKVYGELIDQPSPDSLALAEGALKVREFETRVHRISVHSYPDGLWDTGRALRSRGSLQFPS